MEKRAHREVHINGETFVLDNRTRKFRSCSDPDHCIGFKDLGIEEYRFWYKLLQGVAGQTITSADLAYESRIGFGGWHPVLHFEDGTELWLLSDEEGNGPGRFWLKPPEAE